MAEGLAKTEQVESGHVGKELVVVSRSEFRRVELVHTERVIRTADGEVTARPGDFLVRMPAPSTEEYSIKRSIFLGTYEIVASIDDRRIGKRLQHVRSAWPITSEHLEFRYDDDRGLVTAAKGGWLYMSDDDDLGVINSEQSARSHDLVDFASEVAGPTGRGGCVGQRYS